MITMHVVGAFHAMPRRDGKRFGPAACLLSGCLALLLAMLGPPAARKGSGAASDQPLIAYRVTDLGLHRFLGEPPIPADVAVLLSRRGVRGFSFRDVNRRGERIRNDYGSPDRAYVYRGGKWHALSPLPEVSRCEAEAINNRGDLVGASWDDDSDYAAVLWHHGQIYDLSAHCPPPWRHGHYDPSPFAHAVAINDRGQIVPMYPAQWPNGEFYLLDPVRPHA